MKKIKVLIESNEQFNKRIKGMLKKIDKGTRKKLTEETVSIERG